MTARTTFKTTITTGGIPSAADSVLAAQKASAIRTSATISPIMSIFILWGKHDAK